MRVLIGSLVLVLAVAAAYAVEPTAYNYHQKIGIPKALKIKRSEEYAAKTGQRIVGGSIVDIAEVPYQAGLLIQLLWGRTSICGGCLISNSRVLTAAHCHNDGFFNAQSHTVVLGSNTIFSGGVRQTSRNVEVHPYWNARSIANDVAIIRINPVTFTNVIQPIALPSGSELNRTFVAETAIASGFGITADGADIPQYQRISWVRLPIITNAECAAVFDSFVLDSNICTSGAGGMSTCPGDSGGPLVVKSENRRILVGITSFGAEDGCAAGYPAAYSRVTSFLPWLTAL